MAVHEPPSASSRGAHWGSVPDRRGPSGNAHLRLTHADRDAVTEKLKEAYASGQLDEDEFDERVDLAMSAKFPADLEPLLSDLVPEPTAASAPPAARAQGPVAGNERLLAFFGHGSGYLLSALGPLVVLLLNGNSSAFVRRHATEALNYQLTVIVGSIVMLGLAWLVIPAILWVFMILGWVFMPGIAALVSLLGGGWKYPFTWRPVKNE